MVTILPQAAVLISVSACAPAAMERASAASTSSTTTSRCTGVQWRSYRRRLAAAPTDPSDFCRRYKRAGHPSSSAPSAPNRRVTARPKASVLKATAAARSGTSIFMSKFTTRTCHGNLCAERVRSVLQFQGHRGDDRCPARKNPHRPSCQPSRRTATSYRVHTRMLLAPSRSASCVHHETSCWPPSMSYVPPVSAVLVMM